MKRATKFPSSGKPGSWSRRIYSVFVGWIAAFLFTTCVRAADARALVIVAGQSNVLNWHAAADALPSSRADQEITFYHETGAPPDRGFAVPFNATSAGTWIRLQPQRQNPFVRYQRDFFGPEITLARTLHHAGIRPLGVIKVAYFGSSLAEDWQPDATAGNRLYLRLLAHVRTARAALDGRGEGSRVAGFFWMQGESDATHPSQAKAYEASLQEFFRRLRDDLHTARLPVVLGRIGPAQDASRSGYELVRKAQENIAASDPWTTWIDTDDLPRDIDRVHLLADGVQLLGQRMAESWLHLTSALPASGRP